MAGDMAAMRLRLQAERSEVRAELSEARQAWSNLATLMQQRRTRRSAAPLPVEEAPSLAAEAPPDDLTAIRGVGSNMQQRLNEAGIYTYAQLTASTPEELRQVLGTAARLANVEEWTEQARELAPR